jgi:hypothetical protein
MLTAMGSEGRAFYLTLLLPMDFPCPVIYMLCFFWLIALLLKFAALNNPVEYILTVPVLAMLFDWIENIGIIVMLNSYPNLPEWAATLASVSGMLKMTCFAGSIMTIVILSVYVVNTRTRKKPI